MNIIEIREIPEHIAYMAEYDIESYYDFFDFETGGNHLQALEDLMHRENPEVVVPEIPDDYNYFTHPMGETPRGKMHIKYYDMVDKAGIDNPDGKYKFVTVPAIKAAVTQHTGSFSQVPKSFERIFKQIRKQGLTIVGDSRVSAIHGPWDCQTETEYLLEIQVPVK